MQLFVLGREPHLSLAELESRLGTIKQISPSIALCDLARPVDIATLGGVLKIAEVFKLDAKSEDLSQICSQALANKVATLDLNSVDFGVSTYNFSKFNKLEVLKSIKIALKLQGLKSRFVLATKNELSAAQIIHNKLLTKGSEIILVKDRDNTIVAQTTAVQDIESYSFRDYSRPARDSKVGMFPPKLAQIMISLAQASDKTTIYDPFCGSGVVLQEAMLQGYDVWGSDNASTMVAAAKKNIDWLESEYSIPSKAKIFLNDALSNTQQPQSPYSIVTEGYLGKTFTRELDDYTYQLASSEAANLYMNFLKNICQQKNLPERVVITLPFWKTDRGNKFVNIIDQINSMGYTIKQFDSVDGTKLFYKREQQVVGRQILVLDTKKKAN